MLLLKRTCDVIYRSGIVSNFDCMVSRYIRTPELITLQKMNSIIKISVWLVVAVLVGGQLNHLVQSTMVDAGLLSKPIEMHDAW